MGAAGKVAAALLDRLLHRAVVIQIDDNWVAGFVATNGYWANMAANLISINDSIGELRMHFQTARGHLGNIG